MPYVMVKQKVVEYARWKTNFDADDANREIAGSKGGQLFRSADDPNEVIVLPTRAMRPEDKEYAIAFALQINTPGLKLIASPHGGTPKDPFEHPISARHKMMETLTVFDDVFVPNERIFLNGESDVAGLLPRTRPAKRMSGYNE